MRLQDLKVGDTVELEELSTETAYVGKVVRADDHTVAGWEGTFSVTVETQDGRKFVPECGCDVHDHEEEGIAAFITA